MSDIPKIRGWKAIRSGKTQTVSGTGDDGKPTKVTHVVSIESGPPTMATTADGRVFILADA